MHRAKEMGPIQGGEGVWLVLSSSVDIHLTDVQLETGRVCVESFSCLSTG